VSTFSTLFGWKEPPDDRRILLIDGHGIAYRAYYAIRDLTAPDGRPVNAVYGFWRHLRKLLQAFPSAYVAVAFDAGGRTHRHELHEAYKATRAPMPEDLASQMPMIHHLLETLGVRVLEEEGVEADDILATATRCAGAAGLETLIVSSDKDLAQLVSDRVRLVRPSGRGRNEGFEILDAEGVRSRYGVAPEQLADWLSLVGDASDNVAGVPGVGKKTATKLIEEFGSLGGLLEHVDRVGNARIRDAVAEHADTARLARRLVGLREDLDVGEIPGDLGVGDVDVSRLVDLLSDLGFRSILQELALDTPSAGGPPGPLQRSGTYATISDPQDLARLVTEVAAEETISLDLETTSRDPVSAEIVGVAVALRPYEGYYIPVGHDYLGAPPQLALPVVLKALRPLIEGDTPQIVGQNLKYDILILERHDIHPAGVAFDAMIASHLARPEARRHNLETIARDTLGYEMMTFEEVAGKDGRMAAVPVDTAAAYAAEDAEVVLRVRPSLEAALEEAGATSLFRELELPLIPVLARMERHGILVDRETLRAQGEELRRELGVIEADLIEMAGEPFNPGSPKQVATILFERLGLPVIERTKTGPSTGARVLAELAIQHPLPGRLLAYRELQKLLNTYIDRLPEKINPTTGRIHTSFHQASTATGRLSSSDPNLQNIPIRTKVGERIRRAFVAPAGSVLIGGDYSQIELRLLAHFSEDEAMIAAFESDVDLHRRTASRVFAVPESQVTPQLRQIAKRINFGIIYGISAYGLARQLGTSREEARTYIERFFEAYPQAKATLDRMVERATERGYAETLLGRRRPLLHLASKNVQRRNLDRRNALNTPIQGSAADLIKRAMLEIDREITHGMLGARMLLQIHDELVFEAPKEDAEAAAQRIKTVMEGVMSLRVPLVVSVSWGENWSQIKA